MSLHIEPFYHQSTGTFSYLVINLTDQLAAVIDPVLDFDLASGHYHYQSADQLIAYLTQHAVKLEWILETHAHADHLSAAQYIKARCGGQIVIGKGIQKVQQHFSKVFNLQIPIDGSQFDLLVNAGQSLPFGDYHFTAHPTPGHTNDCMTYQIAENLFIGDTFFHPDTGTARCDFPGGDAALLFDSLSWLLDFPDHYRHWLCHDYPDNREPETGISVARQRLNIHLQQSGNNKQKFVALREKRDSGLAVPKLIYPSVQVNICAGQLPQAEQNGANYLKIPLTEHVSKKSGN